MTEKDFGEMMGNLKENLTNGNYSRVDVGLYSIPPEEPSEEQEEQEEQK